jgi:hypothetical protein
MFHIGSDRCPDVGKGCDFGAGVSLIAEREELSRLFVVQDWSHSVHKRGQGLLPSVASVLIHTRTARVYESAFTLVRSRLRAAREPPLLVPDLTELGPFYTSGAL